MDYKKELDLIINQYGRDVLLIKQDKKRICPCFDEVNSEARRDCPLCLGMGYSYKAEKHRTVAKDNNVSETLSRLIKENNIGGITSGARTYYFKAEMEGAVKDIIIEADWDSLGRPKYNGRGIWSINSVNYNLHIGNETIFKAVYTSEQPVRSNIRGIRIQEINGIKEYEVLMEG